MKLVFLQEQGFPSAIRAWNTDDTAESLRDQGFDCESVEMKSHANKLFGDVFIFYRCMTTDSVLKMRELQAQGKPCGYMIDDLVWDPRFKFAYGESFERSVKQFFRWADFTVFTSEELARVARETFKIDDHRETIIRKPAILERRFYELKRFSEKNRVNDSLSQHPFKILISKGHITDDFKRNVKMLFAEIEEISHSQVFYFSVEDLFPSLGGRVEAVRLNPTDFDAYLREIARICPDVILSPFDRNEFNDCKCYPKYLESGGLSTALLVTDILPYKKIITQGENGILAESDEELASLLHFASKNRTWLRGVGENCRKDVQAHHLLGPIALEFYQRLKEKYGKQEAEG